MNIINKFNILSIDSLNSIIDNTEMNIEEMKVDKLNCKSSFLKNNIDKLIIQQTVKHNEAKLTKRHKLKELNNL